MSRGSVVVLAITHAYPGLVRMLADRVLQGSNTRFVVHHDPRGQEIDLPDDDRVRRVVRPRHIRWGREDLGIAILDSLEFCRSNVPDLEWVLVVSGQDQLCRPMCEIEAELSSVTNDAFVRWLPVPRSSPAIGEHQWQTQCRTRYLRRVRLPYSHHAVPFPRPTPFRGGTELFIGDAWVNLNAQALDHVLEQRRRLSSVERFLARCTATDEALLPTLLLNDSVDLSVEPTTRRFMDWAPRTPHPRTLGHDDVAAIVGSDAFFARKFDDLASAHALGRELA